MSSVARIFSSTLSASKPNCVMMKAGDLSRITARCSEKTASSAVIGLPDAKVMHGRIFKVKVRSEEHTSELQSLMRKSYHVFFLKNKTLSDTMRSFPSHTTQHT